VPDLAVLYVMAGEQINAKSIAFVDELGLRDRVRFLADPGSRAIDRLGLRRPRPEPIERGVPHPTTYVLDREGRVRFVDVREDFHHWLDPRLLVDALRTIP
jgi:peroxiredoxin